MTVQLSSAVPNTVRLAPDSTTAGAGSITLTIAQGNTQANFVVQGIEGATVPATVTVTASAPGFSNGTGTVTVVQPGLQLSSLGTSTTASSPDTNFTVTVGIPAGGNSFVSPSQVVRTGGSALTATVTNSNSTVAQLTTQAGTGQTRTVQIAPGQVSTSFGVANGGIAFDPLSAGTTTVSATIPTFIATTAATVTVNVSP